MAEGVEKQRVVRVLLVDDHPVFRCGLKTLIAAQPDLCVIGEAADGLEAIALIDRTEPDVVLMDVSMPKLGGAQATERLHVTHPDVKVLAVSAHEDAGYVQLLLESGASGYILKRAAADDLVQAIRAVADGGLYVDPAVASKVLSSTARSPGAFSVARGELSEREAEVLRQIALGFAMKEIATSMALSLRTVETYRVRGMEKLQLTTRADLVQHALRRGWLK